MQHVMDTFFEIKKSLLWVVEILPWKKLITWCYTCRFLCTYNPYIEDGKTAVTSPHKIFGPESTHMRELVEQGFEVAVIHDATAAPGMDAYNAGKLNFGLLSSGSLTTKEAV
ncbi:hypothetical protein [Paenibacillus oryzisoli]|uniref:Uncharacterized protein n=1 Tax=Paenibacillus oryzisoli TaxID=1850517 RepID=A0A198AKG2_9BACL|nr:hypothetical protein [Paenibacillus oryzisoli]OAS21531.1 hypothetical protein A8708_16480 [Paenibacillus oryzisoli]